MNPKIRILVRARYLREREDLEQAGATAAVFEEAEAAVALARLVLADAGVHREAADDKIKDLRLQLITENVANIRSQRVRSVMVPWSRVRWLPASATRDQVLAMASQERFSRWPVVESGGRKVKGYLLTKDLVAGAVDSDWHRLIRPLNSVSADETIESVLASLQSERATAYLVEEAKRPVGLITLEDILEQVVGQIEDEYPHQAAVSLTDALARGAFVMDLLATDFEEALRELVAAIPAGRLPGEATRIEIVRLAREREQELSTDLGNGVAIPHARIPGLQAPIVVFGRSCNGVAFPPPSTEPVHLLFMLVTPMEQPESQLALLGQVASVCGDVSDPKRLIEANTPAAVRAILESNLRRKASPPGGGQRPA